MADLLSGVGFGMVIISAIVCVYYNVIIAWTVYYFVLSWSWDLPWATCGNDWNTDYCYIRSGNNSRFNGINVTDRANITLNKTRSPSEEFFESVSQNDNEMSNTDIVHKTHMVQYTIIHRCIMENRWLGDWINHSHMSSSNN